MITDRITQEQKEEQEQKEKVDENNNDIVSWMDFYKDDSLKPKSTSDLNGSLFWFLPSEPEEEKLNVDIKKSTTKLKDKIMKLAKSMAETMSKDFPLLKFDNVDSTAKNSNDEEIEYRQFDADEILYYYNSSSSSEEKRKVSLYLGSYQAACSPDFIATHQIETIISCAYELIEPFKQSITCKKYPLDDVDNSPLSEYILPATKFIHEEFIERKKNILIHCMMGKSRSAAILIAYLMTLSSSSSSFSSFSSVQQALEFLKTKRSIVQPNDGFMKQLKTTFENTFEKAEAKQ